MKNKFKNHKLFDHNIGWDNNFKKNFFIWIILIILAINQLNQGILEVKFFLNQTKKEVILKNNAMKQPDRELKELSIERIKELLGTKKLSDESIKKVMDKIKRFCKVAYELYTKKNKPKNIAEVGKDEKLNEQNQDYHKVA